MKITANAELQAFNSFAVSARCRYLVQIDQPEDIQSLRSDSQLNTLPKLILGGGSNILFKNDFDGLIIHPNLKGIEIVDTDETHIYLRAAAGEVWHDFVQHSLRLGFSGLENLSLIPGTVGAAPIQNIGAYGVEQSDCFFALSAVKLDSGEQLTLSRDDCRFGYRDSIFKHELRDQALITSVTYRLPKQHQAQLAYQGLASAITNENPNALDISAAVCKLRQQKLPDPQQLANAGSFFKNPSISADVYHGLISHYPNLVAYPQADHSWKLSAAWLIEYCGWKGHRQNDAGVYAKHALVLVNHGAASGTQLWQLAEKIQASVYQTFAVHLDIEPIVIG